MRPNGNSGLLVTSFQAYADYQLQRGSNTAWTWEHQAMTRARCVLGSETLRDRFEGIRAAVIASPRDPDALRAEIEAMRERVRTAHPVRAGSFDLKHSPGGMVDVEFAVQYLVLAGSGQHPGLRDNVGNIALLHRAESCGLLPEPVGRNAADAYRALRALQHRARLDERPATMDSEAGAPLRDAVLSLWRAVFPD